MPAFFPQLWNTISQLGTHQKMEFSLRRRVVLSNRVSVLASLLAIILGALLLLASQNPFGVFMTGISSLFFLLLPTLNRLRRHLLSRLLLTLALPIIILVTSIVGKLQQPQQVVVFQYYLPKFFMLLPAILPLILFSLNERRIITFAALFNLLLLLLFDPFHRLLGIDALQLGVITDPRYYYTNVAILVIAISTMGSVLFLQRLNQAYENRILNLLTDQRRANQELQKKERNLTQAFQHLQSAEEELRQNNEWLEREITHRKEKEQELVEQRKRALAAAKAKEDFLSMMSHEIRTPLNAVIGMTHLLINDNPKPEQQENLNILHLSAENLLGLVNDILDFNKIEAGKVILEEAEFDLEELLLNLKRSFQSLAQNKGITLRTLLAPNLPTKLIGDSVRLSQILYNLVSNAIKFTEEGSVTIAVKATEEGLGSDTASLHFLVEDTGIGIAPEKHQAIFDSFVQENSGTTRKYGGSGLGLSIVKRLLELMDSEIQLQSTKDIGSTFSFILTLPLSQTPPATQVLPTAAHSQDLQGLRVLVVEDNAVNQMVIRKFLRKWNAVMETAHNGVEALKLVSSREFDLILMDLQMPEMDGYTATKKIRNLHLGNLHSIPIIALTASVQLDARHRVYEVGMNDFVTKPFVPENLLATIKKHIP